ncbi:hypothetical protein ACFLEY_22795 [Bradyrhizobium sp. YCK136]|uniref:hypothetical protein n=1 Tax=Bradyrhizobium sp. YCK136 TaxID=3351346 RepID=UPI0037C60F81
MPRHWASWWSGNYADEGCTRPPFKTWVSGTRDRDEQRDEQSLCAVVDAQDDMEVKNLISKHYPDAEVRFVDEKPEGWEPGDRYR